MHEAAANLGLPLFVLGEPMVWALVAVASGLLLSILVDALALRYVERRTRVQAPSLRGPAGTRVSFSRESALGTRGEEQAEKGGWRCGLLLSAWSLKLAFAAAYSVLLPGCRTVGAVELLLFACALQFVSRTDAELRVIPNSCMALAFAARSSFLLYALMAGEMNWWQAVGFLAGALLTLGVLVVMAGVFGAFSGHEPMGGGDLKLYALIGLHFGFSRALAVVAASCALAAGVHLALCAARGAIGGDACGHGLQDAVPLGPWISLATMTVMLFG